MKKISTKSIQSQLILYFTIAILVPTVITSVVGVKLIYNQIITRAETKTLSDLNSAREIFRNKITHIESIARLTSARSLIVKALIENNRTFLQKDLLRTLTREHLDVLTILDKNGHLISRSRKLEPDEHSFIRDKFVQRVIDTKRIVKGVDIVSRDYLVNESAHLAEQAAMDIIPTPKSKAHTEHKETSGMMLKAVVPIFEDNGIFVGVLIAGVLLNRNFEVVDKIKEVVHEGEIYKGSEIGTATIFQNDLRISTNVKNQDGSRAISTLVSEEINYEVLQKGNRYVGEAFVVNSWYLSAYEPIRDIENKIIGILYVGILKKPFDDILRNALITFLSIALGGIVLIIFGAVRMAKQISTPLKRIEDIANKIADGDYHHSITVHAPREIEHLAGSINRMAKELEKEKQELEVWGNKLEVKVSERTEEIKKIHAQLFRSEKLASLGKLAAGVAHEINNPLTGILTNSSLLLDDLPASDPRREDIDVIVKETIRCREIVKRLLDFARQTKPQKQIVNINEIIENIILLVRNQTSFRNIQMQRNLHENLPEIMADRDQIQQVFINIIINASEAMSKGGLLSISTAISPVKDSLIITFKDNGPGIPENIREKIFDPFFTTKEQGTGLGLSISYGIIEQHGGEINVESSSGQGTTFIIQLPINSTESE
ncbi:MAG: cache domain-containing protein [Ignavibacteriales bacterium]|nr:cache domain-containing protein [Ignavibacteriales bacterium]